ncbi:solute carrier family 2, facilitated glucose transporter member 1-like [Haliotis rubra]|uniref:solute carrier family 2, facilitated glucose transporter member 1-like n=1 Tax=Haliotis rubra TaxID=36100 RepID=UPI001EE55EF1|nr:solute carrier family 2, facilitated glucose transporter member 1-like [Haliotis rubra]XP_046547085.1 solute carrier family 2, facilitated glucose transporter member 1-like [Haliotis rubra]XP_046547086.1 solute carrier family 2, facilitated glucose transporter member 1-like [Haliotis rubra]
MEEREVNYTFTLIFSITIAVFGNSFLYGYQIGVVNTPSHIIQDFYNATYYERRGGNWSNVQAYASYRDSLNKSITDTVNASTTPGPAEKTPADFGVDESLLLEKWELELLWSSTVAAFVLFGMVGAFLALKVADTVGRKRGMVVITFIMFIAAILGGITVIAKSPECLILSRVLVGLHSGLNITLAPLYLTEIAPKKIRGAVGTCHQLAITVGILFSQILGMAELLGTADLWPLLFAFNVIPSLVCVVVLPFCPESPRWLLISKNMEEETKLAMQKLRGYDNVEDEIDEMRMEAKKSGNAKNFTLKELLTTHDLRMPTLIACVGQVSQQWSGINAVMSYSAFIFAQANVSATNIPYVIVGTGFVNVVATIIAVPLMEKLGRRPLLLWPMCVMAGSFVLMTVFLQLQFDPSLKDSHATFAMICIVLMHLYIVGFALGLGPIPFTIVAEIFRQESRDAAMSLSVACNWICNFILMWTFPFLRDGLEAYTYLLFVVILVAAIIFIFFFVPETKNKTFDEIASSIALGRAQGKSRGFKVNEDESLMGTGTTKV